MFHAKVRIVDTSDNHSLSMDIFSNELEMMSQKIFIVSFIKLE